MNHRLYLLAVILAVFLVCTLVRASRGAEDDPQARARAAVAVALAVRQLPPEPAPPAKAKAKGGDCSPACTCGCQDGLPCTCPRTPAVLPRVQGATPQSPGGARPEVYWLAPAPPAFVPQSYSQPLPAFQSFAPAAGRSSASC